MEKLFIHFVWVCGKMDENLRKLKFSSFYSSRRKEGKNVKRQNEIEENLAKLHQTRNTKNIYI